MDIMQIRVPITPGKDVYCWKDENNGVYSVRSGYRRLQSLRDPEMVNKRTWRCIWRCSVPPKIRHFGWRVWHGILPTRDGLRRRGISVDAECPVCRQGLESIDHIFISCDWAKQVWQQAGIPIGQVANLLGTINQVHNLIEGLVDDSIAGELDLYLMLMWYMWNNRNQVVFQSKLWTATEVVIKSRAYLNQYKETRMRRGQGVSKTTSGWQAPEEGSVKVNCDGAFIDRESTGIGAVIRDSEGLVWGALSGVAENCLSVEEVEANAIWKGMRLAQEMGYRKVFIESDSSRVIAEINSGNQSFATFGDLVHDIRELAAQFNYCCFKHIRRDCNRVADYFASLGRGTGLLHTWVLELPRGVADVIP